jgi:hypothetical protein
MNTHPSDDDLVLHHYGEHEEGEAVEAHLADCAECAARRGALAHVMGVVSEGAVPARGPDYGRQVWARLRPRLRASRRPRLWVWVPLAAAASLLLSFYLGRVSRERELQTARAGVSVPARERILLVSVGEHLERSQMVLVELENAAGNGTVDISGERARVQALLPDNRLLRQAALGAGEAGVAGVLEDLERVLVEVAMSPDAVPAGELAEIRRRMEEEGIVFKVHVLGSRVRERGRMAPGVVRGSQS